MCSRNQEKPIKPEKQRTSIGIEGNQINQKIVLKVLKAKKQQNQEHQLVYANLFTVFRGAAYPRATKKRTSLLIKKEGLRVGTLAPQQPQLLAPKNPEPLDMCICPYEQRKKCRKV